MTATTVNITEKNTPIAEPPRLHDIGLSIDAPSLASAASETIPPEKSRDEFISIGQKTHKWGTYLGVDWLFNTASGVTFAYVGSYTEIGKKIWSGPITNIFTAMLKPVIKNPDQLKKAAGHGNMFMSIIAGGMFTIPPLMILENNKVKKKIVQFIDKCIYGKKDVENDPKFQSSYEDILNEPKKDFSGGMITRFAALAPELAIVLYKPTKALADKCCFNHISFCSKFLAKKMGLRRKTTFPNLPLEEAQTRWKFIHDSIAMDLGLGLPYAVAHSILYNLFTDRKDAKKQAEAQAEAKELHSEHKKYPENADKLEHKNPHDNIKQWASQIEKKSSTLGTTKQNQNFTERLSDKPEMEHQLT